MGVNCFNFTFFVLIRFILPPKTKNKENFDLGLEEDENLMKLQTIAKKQAFAHQRHQKIDAFERLVFEDFNSPLYASKSTISMSNWYSFCDWYTVKRKVEYIDPRGYINISWLFLLGTCSMLRFKQRQTSFFLYVVQCSLILFKQRP